MIAVWTETADIDLTRIDAEFYHPAYVEHEHHVRRVSTSGSIRVERLGSIAKLKTGPFGSKLPSSLYRRAGIPLLRVENVVDYFPKERNLVHLDENAHSALRASESLPGDLLIAKAGRVGDTCILPSRLGPANITEHVISARINTDDDPYYCVAACNSRFTKTQSRRFGLGTIINYLGVEVSRSLRLPMPSETIQIIIGNKIRKAERLLLAATHAKGSIANRLNELLPNIADLPSDLTSWPSQADLIARIDASFYQRRFLELEKRLRKRCLRLPRLADCIRQARNGLDLREFVDVGTPYLRVGDIDPYDCDPALAMKVSTELDNVPEPQRLQEGDLMLTRKGRFGTVAVVDSVLIACIASSEVIRLQLNPKVASYCVAAFLNSPYGQMQMERGSSGTTMQGLTRDALESVLVPMFKDEDESFLTQCMKRAIECGRESRSLVASARSDIESLIECSLDEARLFSEGEELASWLDANPLS